MSNMEDTIKSVPGMSDVKMEFTKPEQTRITALMLAIRYYTDTIVRDAQMYHVLKADDGNKPIMPASSSQVVAIAAEFEDYISKGLMRVRFAPDDTPSPPIPSTDLGPDADLPE
jgi:hypothetical protein